MLTPKPFGITKSGSEVPPTEEHTSDALRIKHSVKVIFPGILIHCNTICWIVPEESQTNRKPLAVARNEAISEANSLRYIFTTKQALFYSVLKSDGKSLSIPSPFIV
jgi:hypothetical protein